MSEVGSFAPRNEDQPEDDADGNTFSFGELFDSLDGLYVVRQNATSAKRTREDRILTQHRKWTEQVDKLAQAYLIFKSNYNTTNNISSITGCAPDVDAPPEGIRVTESASARPILCIDEVLGTQCKSSITTCRAGLCDSDS
jgi:hypothetical protein